MTSINFTSHWFDWTGNRTQDLPHVMPALYLFGVKDKKMMTKIIVDDNNDGDGGSDNDDDTTFQLFIFA